MATRDRRIAEFVTDKDPQAGAAVELLCEDHNGTYLLPFPCRQADGAWQNIKTGEAIQVDVRGWRPW